MADIRCITAPIGGGKSLFAVTQICDELNRSDRYIVTDIPLILENPPDGFWTVADYCHKFIRRGVDVNSRLCVLSQEQAMEFWRYLPAAGFSEAQLQGLEIVENKWKYGHCRMLKLPNIEHPIFKQVPDFTFRTRSVETSKGCHYFIDEAHKKFPPMFFQKVGAQAEWYMSELRKLNDDFTWITQHPEKVDKNFRRDTTEWLHVRNMGRQAMYLGVTLPNRFRFHWYQQPEIPSRSDKPTASGWYKMDKRRRYHHLYRTMDGTGVSGGFMTDGSRFKGKHWSIYLVIIFFIIIIAILIPVVLQWGVEKGVKSALLGIENGATRGVMSAMPHVNPSPVQQRPPEASAVTSQPVIEARPSLPVAPTSLPASGGLYCTGIATLGTNIEVMLSDGSVADSSKGDVQGIGKRWVIVFGEKIPIRYTLPKWDFSSGH